MGLIIQQFLSLNTKNWYRLCSQIQGVGVVMLFYLLVQATATLDLDYHHNNGKGVTIPQGHHDSQKFDKGESSLLCKDIFCPKYQECKIVDGFFPICACKSFCKIHHGKGVCGSNGRWFPNKCELHRESCNSGTKIRIVSNHNCNTANTTLRSLKDLHDKAINVANDVTTKHNVFTIIPNVKKSLEVLKNDNNIIKSTQVKRQIKYSGDYDIKYQDLKSIINDDIETFDEDIDDGKNFKTAGVAYNMKSGIKLDRYKQPYNMTTLSTNQDGIKIDNGQLINSQINGTIIKGLNDGEQEREDHINNDGRLLVEKFATFKEQLKKFFKDQYIDSNDPFISDDPYVINLMLATMDTNNDKYVTAKELSTFYDKWSSFDKRFNLVDDKSFDLLELLEKYDSDEDGKLNITEFYSAFDIKIPNINHSLLPTQYKRVKIGSNVRLNCNAKYLSPGSVIWKRYGSPLNNRELHNIKIFSDGSLYIVGIQPYLGGNYTYQLAENVMAFQTYVVTVLTNPTIKIKPKSSQLVRPGAIATIKCRALGYPAPTKLSWLKNNIPLINTKSGKDKPSAENVPVNKRSNDSKAFSLGLNPNYKFGGNGSILTINNVQYYDTGAYTCQAEGEAGTAVAHSDVFVVEDDNINLDFEEQKHMDKIDLYVFDEAGLKVYDASTCQIRERIKPNLFFKSQDQFMDSRSKRTQKINHKYDRSNNYVCDKGGSQRCHWGQSVNVQNKFIYIIQTRTSRVLVFDLVTHDFKEKIMTDLHPMSMKYLHSLDQIWILCHPSVANNSYTGKTIQVIREASKAAGHEIMHTEPIQGKFDEVENLFLPEHVEDNSLKGKYGYTIHDLKMYMYKLDLELLRYESLVDLSAYNCIPKDVAFYLYGGFVLVRCTNLAGYDKGQIVLDYILDTVIAFDSGIHGVPFISPDQSYVANVDSVTRIIKFQELKQTGIRYLFDIVAPINPTSNTFHLSSTFGTYDFIFASDQQTGLVFFNVYNHQSFDIINEYSLRNDGKELISSIALTSSGPFGNYIALVKGSIIVVFDVIRKGIHCQISDSMGSNVTTQWIHT